MEVKVIEEKEKFIIEIDGDLDIYQSQKFKEEIRDIYEKEARDIEIRAKNMNYLDSTGLGSLISLLKLAREKDKKVYIKDLKKSLYKIFQITKLNELFDIEVQDERN